MNKSIFDFMYLTSTTDCMNALVAQSGRREVTLPVHVVWFIRGLCVVCYSCTEWHSDAAVHVVRRMNRFQPSHQGRARDLPNPTRLGFVLRYLSRSNPLCPPNTPTHAYTPTRAYTRLHTPTHAYTRLHTYLLHSRLTSPHPPR